MLLRILCCKLYFEEIYLHFRSPLSCKSRKGPSRTTPVTKISSLEPYTVVASKFILKFLCD